MRSEYLICSSDKNAFQHDCNVEIVFQIEIQKRGNWKKGEVEKSLNRKYRNEFKTKTIDMKEISKTVMF